MQVLQAEGRCRQMTDEQIIKALECCVTFDCENCPCDGKYNCIAVARKDALDIIKRQQTEIDQLKEISTKRFNDFATEYDNAIKAEAIKEFAARLKANRPHLNTGEQVFYIRPEAVDELVKELAGDFDG